MTVPAWVTVTFELPYASSLVEKRMLEIYSKAERDNAEVPADVNPIHGPIEIAADTRIYQYDMKMQVGANTMLEVVMWDVDEDNRESEKLVQVFAINDNNPRLNKLPAPGPLRILCIDEASSESSESDESSQS